MRTVSRVLPPVSSYQAAWRELGVTTFTKISGEVVADRVTPK